MMNLNNRSVRGLVLLLATVVWSGGCGPADGSAGPTATGAAGSSALGETLEGVYVITLAECLHVGRLAFEDRKITLTHQESHSAWAAVDGRCDDSTPARIKGQDLGEMRTKVLFTVGTQKSDLNKARVRALKEGFEERLLVASPRDP